jgi:hypothetical protein
MGQGIMKRSLCLLVLVFFFSVIFVMAEEEKIPRGMEMFKIGETRILLPQGAKVSKNGDLLVLENAAEYASRRILDMQEELEQLRASVEDLRVQVEELKKALDANKNKIQADAQAQANP